MGRLPSGLEQHMEALGQIALVRTEQLPFLGLATAWCQRLLPGLLHWLLHWLLCIGSCIEYRTASIPALVSYNKFRSGFCISWFIELVPSHYICLVWRLEVTGQLNQ